MYSGIFETGADSQEPLQIEPFRTDFLAQPVYLKYTNLESGSYEYLDEILAGMESIISNLKTKIEKTGTVPVQCREQAAGIKKFRFFKIAGFIQKLFAWLPGKKKKTKT